MDPGFNHNSLARKMACLFTWHLEVGGALQRLLVDQYAFL